MHKFIFLKKYLPFLIALAIHALFLIILIDKKETTKLEILKRSQITFDLLQPPPKSYKIPTSSPKGLSKNKKSTSPQIAPRPSTPATNNSTASSTSTGTANENLSSGTNLGADAIVFTQFENPIYPTLARKREIEGSIKLKIIFNSDGEIEKIEMLESSHSTLLDNATLESVKKWHITPGKRRELTKTFDFKLN